MDQLNAPPVEKYLSLIASYDSEFSKWEARVKKILKRYRDDTRSNSGNEAAKFNILWSNIQTLIPAVYARLPTADVSRRFGDNDQVGRVAAEIISRSLDFEIEHYPDFRATMRQCVEDRFLGGRGVAWARYEPHVRTQAVPDDGLGVTNSIEAGEISDQQSSGGPEEIEYECAPVDYVHWKDFGHSPARTWEEVTCVWRWVYMSYEALVERFGEEAARGIPLDSGPDALNSYAERKRTLNRAKICELWDKEENRVYWLSKNLPQPVDVRDDPLGVEGFFPCPKPLYATITSDTLVPVPDFVLYQDQANELDILSDRIDGLIKALRVRGVYDSSQPALQRLLTEGDNNTLIPVDKWAAFGEKGGLQGSIDLLPLNTIAEALMQCYQAQANVKGQIYEITGIADILRGATAAAETATAQQIKSNFAGLRLGSMQQDVALFASEVLRLKAQIMCSKFQPQTLLAYSAAQQMTPADQQMIPQALQLLADRPLRNFRIQVAEDSLVQLDQEQNKRDRVEFLQAFGGFLQQALPVGQGAPEMVPAMMEILKFGVTGFKQARPIEGAINSALDQLKQKAAQMAQAPPPPDPEKAKLDAQMQLAQMKAQADVQERAQKVQLDAQLHDARVKADMQIEQMKAQVMQQVEQQKMQLEQTKFQHEMQLRGQLEQQKQDFDRWKAELEASTRLTIARISAGQPEDAGMQAAQIAATDNLAQSLQTTMGALGQLGSNIAQSHQAMQMGLDALKTAVTAPKRVVRGPNGLVSHVEVIAQPMGTMQ